MLGFLVLGSLLAIPSYLSVLFRFQQRLVAIVPALPAGGTGYVYVMITGAEAEPGGTVSAEIRTPGGSRRGMAKLSERGTAVLPLQLERFPPGEARLTVQTGDIRIERQVAIQPTDRLRLWATTRSGAIETEINALLSIRSAVTGRGIDGTSGGCAGQSQ